MRRSEILGSMALVVLASPAAANTTDTTTTVATAEVLTPIAISHDVGAALNFGTFLPGSGGTINVPVTGGHSTGGSIMLIGGSVPTRDSFTITGESGRSFSISATAGTIRSGVDSMTYSTSLRDISGTFDLTGRTTLFVGGRLAVAPSQAPGRYTGNYNVTVSYN